MVSFGFICYIYTHEPNDLLTQLPYFHKNIQSFGK